MLRLWNENWVHCRRSPREARLRGFQEGGHYGYIEYRDEKGENPRYYVQPAAFEHPSVCVEVTAEEFDRYFVRCRRTLTAPERRQNLSDLVSARRSCCPVCSWPF